MKRNNKVVCYFRFATAEQVDNKVNALCTDAKENSYDIEKIIAEHKSGLAPISDEFYKRLRNTDIQYILAPGICGISRNNVTLLEAIKATKIFDKTIISLDGNVEKINHNTT